MKIINRTEFLLMPANTLFSKYKSCTFDVLAIKGETVGNDFYVQSIADAIDANDTNEYMDKMDRAENGETVRLDLNCEGRDGLFDDEQLFVVYDRDDLAQIIGRLNLCLE